MCLAIYFSNQEVFFLVSLFSHHFSALTVNGAKVERLEGTDMVERRNGKRAVEGREWPKRGKRAVARGQRAKEGTEGRRGARGP